MFYCIYKITNKINSKTYIGQHKYKDLNDSYMGSGFLLAKAKIKYGIENFEKDILYSRIRDKETADSMEKFAIKKERSIGKAEYNIADGGTGGNLGEVVNKKISESLKCRQFSEEWKRKLSAAKRGKPKTEEHKRKVSESLKDHIVSEETRKKMSEAKKENQYGKGKPSPMKGRHWKLVEGKRVWY